MFTRDAGTWTDHVSSSPVIATKEKLVEVLVETRNLKTHFPILKGVLRRPAGAVRAVDGINLTISNEHSVRLLSMEKGTFLYKQKHLNNEED